MLMNAAPINTTPINGAGEGGPSAAAPQTGQAVGFASGAFGAPAAGGSFGAIGIAPVARFGYPLATTYKPTVVSRTAAAQSVHSTVFGNPAARSSVTSQAESLIVAAWFGAARAGTTQYVQAVAPTATFGAAAAGATAHARGFRLVSFGATTAGRVQHAEGVYRPARLGTHAVVWYSLHPADPVLPSTQFGQHSASRAGRVLHTAPVARFGKPLVQRDNQC